MAFTRTDFVEGESYSDQDFTFDYQTYKKTGEGDYWLLLGNPLIVLEHNPKNQNSNESLHCLFKSNIYQLTFESVVVEPSGEDKTYIFKRYEDEVITYIIQGLISIEDVSVSNGNLVLDCYDEDEIGRFEAVFSKSQ